MLITSWLLALACAPQTAPSILRAPPPPLTLAPPRAWAMDAGVARVRSRARPDVGLAVGGGRAVVEIAGGEALAVRVAHSGAAPDGPVYVDCAPTREPGACEPAAWQARGDLASWWTSGPEGFHHGLVWRGGAGPLVIDLEFPGAQIARVDADEVTLAAAGVTWRYAGLRAWDRQGRDVPARFAAAGGRVELRVDATGPVWIDPVLVAEDWSWTETYAQGFASVEYGAAPFADVDGDGDRDLVLTLGQHPWVYLGDGRGGLARTVDAPGDHACAAGADLDGDGRSEIVCVAGGMQVYDVDSAGVRTTRATLTTGMTYSGFGRGISLGDVNGDGYGDVAIGQAAAFPTDPPRGQLRWMLGGLNPALWVWHRTVPLGGAHTWTTLRVSTGFDLDGDGYDDTVVSEPGCGNPLSGWRAADAPDTPGDVLYFPGGPAGPDAEPAWRWSDVRAPDVDPCDGWDAELSPDVDGDGLPDLVISGREAVHVLPGGPGGPGATPLWVGGGEPGCWGTGATACEIPVLRGVGVGDINGDGHGDVAVVEAHALRVHLGRPGGVSDEPLWVFPDDHGPLDVARVGDRDGDGIDELLVLTPFEVSGNQYVGAARLYDGRPETDLDLDGVANELDCAPYDPDVHPGAAEIGGGHVDEDCDGAFGCFADADGDGAAGTLVGVPLATPSCASAGLSDALTDCVDDDPASLAFGPEVADNDVDEDCDGRLACRLDLDGDGAGGPSPVLLDGPSCLADPRHDADLADCDDGDPDIGPGAAEVAGGVVDEDCDGTVDCYVDGDGDGVGQAVAVVASPDMTCDHVGMSPRGSDCDDHDPTVSPDAAVVANDLIDQDCSGAIECWRDADGDGWGGAPIDYPGRATCVGVSGTAQRGGDCDDGNYRTWPGAPELDDGLDAAQADNNCDGAVGCLRDEDGDRWGGQEIVWFSVTPGAWSQCTQRLGLVTRGGDCDDHDAAISPAANENVVTPGDEDCDGVEWCCDFDVDGDGQDARSVCTPTAMTGGRVCPTTPATTDPRDCDDHDPTVFAGAVEIPGDGVDQDCDDALDCFADDDGDSYVGARVYQEMLDAWCTLDDPCIVDTDGDGDFDLLVRDPLRPVSQCPYDLGPDCDDGDPDVNPGAPDLGGDRVDGDCDGPDGLGLTAWFTAPNANFRVEPVYPQDDLLVFVSLVGPGRGPCPASIQRSCLSLLQPQLVVRGHVGAAGGSWTGQKSLPPTASGRTVWLQAWTDDGERSSRVVRWTLP